MAVRTDTASGLVLFQPSQSTLQYSLVKKSASWPSMVITLRWSTNSIPELCFHYSCCPHTSMQNIILHINKEPLVFFKKKLHSCRHLRNSWNWRNNRGWWRDKRNECWMVRLCYRGFLQNKPQNTLTTYVSPLGWYYADKPIWVESKRHLGGNLNRSHKRWSTSLSYRNCCHTN